jgi:small-conductance mechanosensitive channel
MRELTVEAGIGYGVAWRTVHKLLIEASLETSGILAAPAPMLTQMALRDFAVNF